MSTLYICLLYIEARDMAKERIKQEVRETWPTLLELKGWYGRLVTTGTEITGGSETPRGVTLLSLHMVILAFSVKDSGWFQTSVNLIPWK